ncbi:MAG TPA: hypothetical protein VMH22_00850 [bacterium]|nr:hypothetical protein [bacterium]
MRICRVVPIACLLVLAACSNNHAPIVPSLLVPDMAQRGDSVWAQVQSYDRGGHLMYFLIDWGDGTQSGWVGPVPSVTAYAVPHVYTDTGVFGVLAKAKDSTSETGWSDTSFIHIGEFGPFVPNRPSGPDTVKVADSVDYFTSAGHPLYRRVSIQFDWGDTLGDWSEFMAPSASYYARHAFSRSGIMPVRARAKDSLDHVSDWSRPESVTVVP